MPYLTLDERQKVIANAALMLRHQQPFQALVEAWVSDFIDLNQKALVLDGAALYRAQGAAMQLRDMLESVFGADRVAERIAENTARDLQKGRDTTIESMPERRSYQP
jgi:hypothetical protein